MTEEKENDKFDRLIDALEKMNNALLENNKKLISILTQIETKLGYIEDNLYSIKIRL